MATEVQNRSEPTLTSLVTGIVSDVQDLVKQQLLLTRKEIENDLRKTWDAAMFFGVGVGISLLSAISFCLMFAHLLHWLTAPHGTDLASMPLWACHGVVGAVLGIIGGVFVSMGKQNLKSVDPLHNPATQALKENVQWMTNTK
jgi:hypothetical protein